MTSYIFSSIDHIAYVFNTLRDGYEFFALHPNIKTIKGPALNATQNVYYLFIEVPNIGVIEILAPSNENSPVVKRLKTVGPGLYHICYAVENIDLAIKHCEEAEWKLVLHPTPDSAFSGRRISFLSHKSFGLIELVEKTVSQDLIDALESSISYPKDQVTKPYPDNIEQSSRFYGKRVDIHSKLVELLNQSTDEYEGDELVEKFTEIDSWDSLSHAIFHSRFEEYVGKALPIDRFADLSDYLTFLSRNPVH